MTSGRLGCRAGIDGLRALSILLVAAFHAGLAGFEGGGAGVDVFFVLSGYLITSLLVAEQVRTGRIALADFVARRVRRLLPLAALVITIRSCSGSGCCRRRSAGSWRSMPWRRASMWRTGARLLRPRPTPTCR